jgi:hypothetical protein
VPATPATLEPLRRGGSRATAVLERESRGGCAGAAARKAKLNLSYSCTAASTADAKIGLTDLTLSCAAGAHVPKADAARRLPRMTFEEPSCDLQAP